ncbi:hypothetical protein NEOLEDRAFT_1149744 [Neolentinus lepideus HHB14362 ss-1]|uniref:F-box domain-containing protein n=1 Tax=Neolentinus lepideus HHB14362 ss-1 TaxID=1314782 RepID=A0A165QSF9_9AGAM|nr:hypothetical protein NEOLEDRAFT_1149744 [Neolentinus lepideus HHB14362 ss-1]
MAWIKSAAKSRADAEYRSTRQHVLLTRLRLDAISVHSDPGSELFSRIRRFMSRKSRKNYQYCSKTIASQRKTGINDVLPPEIILEILEALASVSLPGWPSSDEPFDDTQNDQWNLAEELVEAAFERAWLCSALLVCKEWYSLDETHQSFAVEHGRSLARVLAACDALKHLILTPCESTLDREYHLWDFQELIVRSMATQRLTLLALVGPTTEILFQGDELCFPVLEELHIACTVIEPQWSHWSRLPALRIVRLKDLSIPPSVSLPVAPLESLDLWGLSISTPLHSVVRIIHSTYRYSLKKLTINVGWLSRTYDPMYEIMEGIDYSLLERLEALTLMFVDVVPVHLPLSIRHLSKLSYMRLVWSTESFASDLAGILMDVDAFPCLKLIEVLAHDDVSRQPIYGRCMALLSCQCRARDVRLNAQHMLPVEE